jgi:methionyl-tRNA synthetase
MADYRFHLSIRALRDLWSECNRYFDDKAPWQAVKSDPGDAAATLSTAVHLCRIVAVLSAPFLPETAGSIFGLLGLDQDVHQARWEDAGDFGSLTGHRIPAKPRPLFRKIEDQEVSELHRRFAGG